MEFDEQNKEKKTQELLRILDSQLLRDNAPDLSSQCVQLLLKIISNILENPYDRKYRQISLKNPKLNQTLGRATGGMEFLYAIGFKKEIIEFQEYAVWDQIDGTILQLGKEVLLKRKSLIEDKKKRSEEQKLKDFNQSRMEKELILKQIEEDKKLRRDKFGLK